MSDKKRVSRAPRGYRIVLWADGFYHVYFGGECIDEVLSRWAGIAVCKKHKAAQQGVYWTQGIHSAEMLLSHPEYSTTAQALSTPALRQ
jgi:hypothetical protein